MSGRQVSIAQGLVARGYGMAQAKAAAPGIIGRTVQTQAATIAYEGAFLVSGVVFVLVLPLVFFLREGDAKQSAGAAH